MVFSSSIFLIVFLPVVFSVYYLICALPHKSLKAANIWLLVSSLLFYASGEPKFVALMVFSVAMNWAVGRLIIQNEKSEKKKAIVTVGCILNILLLFIFKYFEWIVGHDFKFITLPIGISFYTFQALSYILDVYRGGYTKEQTGPVNVGLYIAFFPQLIAGPIVRFSTVAQQIQDREHSVDKVSSGLWRFCIGLSKKVLIANQIAPFADLAFSSASSNSVLMAWIGAMASVLQIYFDFSGYSDMAIGLGRMFGFEFNENFNYPFVSKSITEYWRRWHISLGEWFRDYLFYPLSLGPGIKIQSKLMKKYGRKKAKDVASFFILLTVWLATGIWHGANLTFILWGLLQFVFIIEEQYVKPKKVLSRIKVLLVCIVGGVIFNADSISHAGKYLADMLCLGGNRFVDDAVIYWLGQYGLLLAAALVFSLPVVPALDRLCGKNKASNSVWTFVKFPVMVCFFIVSLSYVISNGYNPFIYFNF